MNKTIQNNINDLIIQQKGSSEYTNIIIKEAIIKFFLRFFVLLILLILSLIFSDKISKLSMIMETTIIDNFSVFGPVIYFCILYFSCILSLIYGLYIIYNYKFTDLKSFKTLKNIYKTYNLFDIIVFTLSTIVYFYFIIMFILTPCTIDGDSMNNTYSDGDKVVVWHVNYKPQYDDVVVFDSTNELYGNYSGFWIKRVKGIPGQIVSIDSNKMLICNGESLKKITDLDYYNIIRSVGINTFSTEEFIIPEGRYLLIGDNRINSQDSVYLGLIYENDILGKVITRFYPFQDLGLPKEENND